jgi:hypothetical protein
MAALKEKFAKEYETQFITALKEVRLPQTKGVVAEIARYISQATEIGYEMTPTEAAKLVREDIEDRQRRLYVDSDAETLVKLLGDDALKKIRDYDVGRLKDPNSILKTPLEQPGDRRAPRRTKDVKRMSSAEWRQFNRK